MFATRLAITIWFMAGGITLAMAQASLTAAMAALEAAGTAQEYQIVAATGGRRVQRASYADLLKAVQYWEQKVASLSRGGIRIQSVVPL